VSPSTSNSFIVSQGSTITGVVGSTLASSIEVASDAVARGVRESLGESEQQLAMTLDKARKQVVSLKQELSNTSAELRESRAELDSLRSALSLVEDPQAVLEAERIYKVRG
jgi:ABC-type transporter Mla subunit MlaD